MRSSKNTSKFLPFLVFIALAVALFVVFQKRLIGNTPTSFNSEKPGSLAFQNGDIIFHTSTSDQSRAIQLATKSELSHCGLLFIDGGKTLVLEAIQPVKITPLTEWIARGKDGKYLLKRLHNAEAVFTTTVQKKMFQEGVNMLGKEYDYYFGWSDDKIYCSELVWKIYKNGAGIELGKLQQLKEFDLSSAPVQQKMKERYGNNIPLTEQVISPAAIAASDKLVTIHEF